MDLPKSQAEQIGALSLLEKPMSFFVASKIMTKTFVPLSKLDGISRVDVGTPRMYTSVRSKSVISMLDDGLEHSFDIHVVQSRLERANHEGLAEM